MRGKSGIINVGLMPLCSPEGNAAACLIQARFICHSLVLIPSSGLFQMTFFCHGPKALEDLFKSFRFHNYCISADNTGRITVNCHGTEPLGFLYVRLFHSELFFPQ